MNFNLLCSLLLFSLVLVLSDKPCSKLRMRYGNVCVCNSTYCDTINRPKRLARGHFHYYYTSKDSPGFNHVTGSFKKKPSTHNGIHFDVNPKEKFQKLRGFGGAFTDCFGSAFNKLPNDAQEKLMKSFFSEEGLEYTVCRIVLGSSDFSLRNYSYVEHYDPSLKSFTLTMDDYLYKIPHVKWALSMTKRPISFLGSTWTAPSWMKTNNDPTSGFLKPEFRQVWADYYIKSLNAFKKEGINFWALTTGNEPVTLYLVKNQTNLAIFPEEQRDWFINNLGPALKKANYGHLKIIFLDDFRIFVNWWMEIIMRNHKQINEFSTGVGIHWYSDSVSDPKVLDEMHEMYPKQELMYTESSVNKVIGLFDTPNSKSNSPSFGDAGIPKLGHWGRATMYATNIIENLNHWVTTYMDWNLALNMKGGPNLVNSSCDASIIIDEEAGVFYKQPIYYVMAHFSKFLAPGSRVISVKKVHNANEYLATQNSHRKKPMFKPHINKNVQLLGVVNPDGSHAIVFYNPKPHKVNLIVNDPSRGYATFTIKRHSISTLLYW